MHLKTSIQQVLAVALTRTVRRVTVYFCCGINSVALRSIGEFRMSLYVITVGSSLVSLPITTTLCHLHSMLKWWPHHSWGRTIVSISTTKYYFTNLCFFGGELFTRRFRERRHAWNTLCFFTLNDLPAGHYTLVAVLHTTRSSMHTFASLNAETPTCSRADQLADFRLYSLAS